MMRRKHINDYRDGNGLHRFLESKVGQPWNKVYSEVLSFSDSRAENGSQWDIRKRLGWNVSTDITMVNGEPHNFGRLCYMPVRGLYVHPVTGLLCLSKDKPRVKKKPKVEKVFWEGNTWFELETFRKKAKCGCVSFKVPQLADKRGYKIYRDDPAVCIHKNEPIAQEIWYVIEYGQHGLDEVYKTIKAYTVFDLTKYNLESIGDIKHLYYRDYPDVERSYIKTKKQANHKELKILRNILTTK